MFTTGRFLIQWGFTLLTFYTTIGGLNRDNNCYWLGRDSQRYSRLEIMIGSLIFGGGQVRGWVPTAEEFLGALSELCLR